MHSSLDLGDAANTPRSLENFKKKINEQKQTETIDVREFLECARKPKTGEHEPENQK
jgi:hypothetical protein